MMLQIRDVDGTYDAPDDLEAPHILNWYLKVILLFYFKYNLCFDEPSKLVCFQTVQLFKKKDTSISEKNEIQAIRQVLGSTTNIFEVDVGASDWEYTPMWPPKSTQEPSSEESTPNFPDSLLSRSRSIRFSCFVQIVSLLCAIKWGVA